MAWSFPYLGENEELDERARARAPGDFVRLSDGHTHYELAGPESGAGVVLVHGFSVPSFIWDPTFHFLSGQGCRVLRYDLFGRGYSDRPRVHYTLDLFCRQLRELLDSLGMHKPVHLLGLSMGGPVCAAFTTRNPGRVARLILIDPAGARAVQLSAGLKIATLPWIGELLFGLFGGETLVKGIAADFFGPDLVAAFQERYRVQMRYKGFKRAILSTLRNGLLEDFSPLYLELAGQRVPTMLLWGEHDRTVPFEHSQDLRALLPGVEFHVIEGCGHIPHYEKPEQVNHKIIGFLAA